MARVRIENFQAIDKLEVEVDGLTAIVGRSNIGKSAIVRALECALSGASGTDFVRHDPRTCSRIKKGRKTCSCKATVEIDFGDHRIVWEKGDQDNKYTVHKNGDKQVYDSIGRGTPEFLEPDFSPVKLGDSPYVVQIGEQFTGPLFLLNQPGSVVADVLSDVARLDEINEASRLVGKDKREAQGTFKVRQKDLEKVEKELGSYDNLDGTLSEIDEVAQRWDAVSEKADRLETVNRFYDKLRNLAPLVKSLTAATERSLPDLETLGELDAKLGRIVRFLEKTSGLLPLVRNLTAATKADPPDLSELESRFQVAGVLGAMESVSARVEALEGVERLELPEVDFGDKLACLARVGEWLSRVVTLRMKLQGKEPIESLEIPVFTLDTKLQNLMVADRLCRRQETLDRAIEALLGKTEAATSKVDDLQKQIDDIGICPTCNTDIRSGKHEAHE